MKLLLGILALATAASGSGHALAGQPPDRKLLDKVPVHPAATPVPTGTDTLPNPQLGFTLESGQLYLAKAAPEAVVKFYQAKLSAHEVSSAQFEESLEQAETGELDKVVFTLVPPDFQSPAVKPMAGAIKKRPPYRPGEWVAWARFAWCERQPDGEVALFGVGILDGMDRRRPNEARTVLWLTAGAPGNETGEPGEPGTREEVDAVPPPMAEPEAAKLGVERYPGAVFDGSNSAGMSSDVERYYIFTSTDPPEKVIAFYERTTGKKRTKTEGGVLIAVKGTGPFPELGVTIQPNPGSYPAAVKTMITVRRVER